MNFEKYAETNLQGMTDTARRIAQMAWNAGVASCSENPNSSGQASRQAIESEPVAWTLQWDNGPVNHFTVYPTREKAEDYVSLCEISSDKGRIKIVPLYTHPASSDEAKHHVVLQAQIWAQEARPQKAIVKEIGELVGCANDWEMVEAVRDALANVCVSQSAESETQTNLQRTDDTQTLGQRKAAQIGKTIGVLAQNQDGKVCAVTDMGRCTWLSEDVTGAGGALTDEGTRQAVSVPEGWKLVPIEPTQSMVDAAFDAFEVVKPMQYGSGTEARNAVYASMIGAAPQPPEQEQGHE